MPKLLFTVALLALLCACATGDRRGGSLTASRAPSPSSVATPATPPPDIEADATRREGAGSFNQYRYTFKRTGNETEAVFAPRRLPWNDNVVVAAARELIVSAFDDRSDNFPRPVEFSYGVNAIKLEGERYEYVFFPVEETSGGVKEARAIRMWRLNKGSIR